MKTIISKTLKHELWILFTWLDHFDGQIVIHGVDCGQNELCLENKVIGFMCNFDLGDLKTIKGLNKLLCMWANSSAGTRTDFDGNDIFEIAAEEKWNRINTG